MEDDCSSSSTLWKGGSTHHSRNRIQNSSTGIAMLDNHSAENNRCPSYNNCHSQQNATTSTTNSSDDQCDSFDELWNDNSPPYPGSSSDEVANNIYLQKGSETASNTATKIPTPPRKSKIFSKHKHLDITVDDLTKEIGKLWWPKEDQEKKENNRPRSIVPDEANSDSATSNSKQENFLRDRAKKLASVSIQSTMEKIWAKELYEMDPKEREDISNEIHGVQSSRAIQETPEIISEGIQSLRDYIDQTLDDELDNGDSIVPPVTKDAYKRGISFESVGEKGNGEVHYIRTKMFLLKFLRASHFDIEKAALRYFRCLDLTYGLFGDVALKRPLMLSDLTKRELRYLKKGQMQLLPSRDRAGRRIFAFSGCEVRNFDVREKYRACVYLHDVCSQDETTQKLGLVSLQSPKIDPGTKPFGEAGMALQKKKHESLGGLDEREYLHKFSEGRPLRISAIHYTGPDTFIYQIGKSLILFLLPKRDRKIVRFHGGSQMEINYSLRSFGILPDEVPIKNNGQIKTKNIAKSLAARRSIEDREAKQYQKQQQQRQPQKRKREHETTTTTVMPPLRLGVECPGVNSVILGSRAKYNHANLEFRHLLKVMEADREKKIVRCDKNVSSMNDFIHSIIQTARSPEHGLQFLKIDKETSLFVEIDDAQELYNKVSQSLRDQRKRLRIECRVQHERNKKGQQEEHRRNEVPLFDSLNDKNGASIMGWDAAKRFRSTSSTACGSTCIFW
eukprot:CAMPEP_0168198778 /NCGR_PEP_ID=MMETSP0139_2-20121125/22003_1 /TAXON_ID=44445 /ORGANISM="Pseudo-nitzschia australis, Strain 10249 10 AB" /LENGTH=732 /DNA_ID=CAMNT_0008123587 /DNA_START=252 /DNA_END=2447 /DNA_ORIENTATION=+